MPLKISNDVFDPSKAMKEPAQRRWLSSCVAVNSSHLLLLLIFFFGGCQGGRNKHLNPLMEIPGLSFHQADHLACHLCGQQAYGKQSITFRKFQDCIMLVFSFHYMTLRIEEFYPFLQIVLPTGIRK